ncbi:MAG: GTP cyclohydrolase II [Rhodospirillaceae bacterium]
MPLSSLSQADASSLRLVDRARVALRSGEIVALLGDDGGLSLTLAVETLGAEALARLRDLTGRAPVLALTRWRAAALGLIETGGPGVIVLTPTRELSVGAIHALVEPGSLPRADLPAVSARDAEELEIAAVRLTKLAALLPVAVLTGTDTIAEKTLPSVRASDVADYQRRAARALRRVADAPVPLADAPDTRIIAFRPSNGGHEHLAIVIGTPQPGEPVLVRLHSECFTGDILGSLRCDCGEQLRRAIADIGKLGGGMVLYLAQEGRGIGLVNKLRAYRLQDQGYDTLDANEMLGFDADERFYLPAAEMLHQLGFDRVRLMTNNPDKMRQLARCGIEVVERVSHIIPGNDYNAAYLRTKVERGGHLL